MSVSAVITAAGRNSRMEESQIAKNIPIINKLCLPFFNRTIIETTISNVLSANVDECIIVLGHFAEDIKDIVDNISDNRIKIVKNKDIDVGLSKSLLNGLKHCENNTVLCLAADQPTVSTNTYNKIIESLANFKDSKNTVSILRRKDTGILDSAEGLGMPFAMDKNSLSNYLIGEDDNLNPILRKIFKDNFCFYAVKEENNLELININDYEDYNFVLNHK